MSRYTAKVKSHYCTSKEFDYVPVQFIFSHFFNVEY